MTGLEPVSPSNVEGALPFKLHKSPDGTCTGFIFYYQALYSLPKLARVERIELSYAVLETAVLPLNYTHIF